VILDEIELLVGCEKRMRFMALFAGTDVTFPKQPRGPFFEQLSRALGADAAERLRLRYAGERIYIPRNEADERARRNAEIAARIAAGESPAYVARTYRVMSTLSARHIRRIVEKAGSMLKPTQPELFGDK
jgi:hypothetical protein